MDRTPVCSSHVRSVGYGTFVGRDWIRTTIFGLKDKGKVGCSGKGRAARWRYKGD